MHSLNPSNIERIFVNSNNPERQIQIIFNQIDYSLTTFLRSKYVNKKLFCIKHNQKKTGKLFEPPDRIYANYANYIQLFRTQLRK